MIENNKVQIGLRIKQIRIERKETLEEFANQIQKNTNFTIKTTKSNVSKWEKGLNIPNDITLKAISNLGNTTVQELLYGDARNYITPFVISIAKKYYNFDISEDSDSVNHIINRINYSFDDDENSLYYDNKETFDNILLYPWEWDSSGFIQYTSTKIFELTKSIQEYQNSCTDSFDKETQKDISSTVNLIVNKLNNTKNDIEKITIDHRYTVTTRLQKEIDDNANSEILDPKIPGTE
ncbi:helix-turn-helix domain-containing protein [Vagococcus fluvialis]|uniref:helix-turn-helix domain-containing protein n=1 Tax=Vagococcus fluvialis TaxID=2738 RepID=UPI001D0A6032|nr:helix-turn-helix transcriptional regulator [Vagococcus fluvialis]UDM74022.1 helix-turn-helix domain-containing protein [Vagococcus fluvialis]